MNRLPELIAAYLSMDAFARNVILESAKAYALARPNSASRAQLRILPRPLNDHPVLNGGRDTQKKDLIGVSCETVDK